MAMVNVVNGVVGKVTTNAKKDVLQARVTNPQEIWNLSTPKERGLIYKNPNKTATIFECEIPRGLSIKISFLGHPNTHVLTYNGGKRVQMMKYSTWANKRFQHQL